MRLKYSSKEGRRRSFVVFQNEDSIILSKKNYAIVNIKDISHFEKGTTVNAEKLKDAGIIKKILDGIKVLGDGEIKNPLTVIAHKFSKVAKEKILTAGGEAKTVL